jgi:hypothetical protein
MVDVGAGADWCDAVGVRSEGRVGAWVGGVPARMYCRMAPAMTAAMISGQRARAMNVGRRSGSLCHMIASYAQYCHARMLLSIFAVGRCTLTLTIPSTL